MSYKIPLLGGTKSKPLDDSQLTGILVRMCLLVWRVKYAEQTAGLQDEPALDYSIKYLETLEHTSALVQASKPDGGKRKKSGQDDKKTKRSKTSKNAGKKDKFFQNCKDDGRPEWLYTNHNTKDCKKRVTMAKQVKAVIKAPVKSIMRRCLLHFLNLKNGMIKSPKKIQEKIQKAPSDSDSDSDSS